MPNLLDGASTMTLLLIAICVGVSVPGFWALNKNQYRSYFLFIPSKVAKGEKLVGAVVSHFAHGDVWHLLFNMLTLYFFGPEVEAALGMLPYLLLYAVSGAVGTFAVFLIRRKNPRHSALGASGSIAGVIFATVVIAPTSTIYLMFLPFPIPAPIFAVLYLIVSSFMMGRGDRVAHEAHIGGAVAGLGLAGLLFEGGFGPLIRAVTALVS